jgi:Helix-turn-helix domain
VNHAPVTSSRPRTGNLRFQAAVRDADLGRGAAPLKAVLFALASAAGKDGTCYPSLTTLAVWSGLSARRTSSTLAEARERGLVSAVGTRRGPNGQETTLHRLNVEAIEALARRRKGTDGASWVNPLTTDGASVPAHEGTDGASGRPLTERPKGTDGASDKDTSEETNEETTRKRVRGVRSPSEPIHLPDDLRTPELEAAWSAWLAHLTERRKPLTGPQAERAFARLRSAPAHERTLMVLAAVEGGWTRIFPLNKTAGTSPPGNRRAFKGAQT